MPTPPSLPEDSAPGSTPPPHPPAPSSSPPLSPPSVPPRTTPPVAPLPVAPSAANQVMEKIVGAIKRVDWQQLGKDLKVFGKRFAGSDFARIQPEPHEQP